MFDTMTLTKAVAGICGTLLVFMLGGMAAKSIYSTGGGHGDHAQAYVIEVEGGDDHGAPADEGPAFEEVYATASAEDGEGKFRQCAACHKLAEGENGTGPSLYGIVGRTVGTEAGFGYSGALVAVADVWTPEALNEFLEKPSNFAPGTAMSYNGMRKIEDRADLIAYLDSLDD